MLVVHDSMNVWVKWFLILFRTAYKYHFTENDRNIQWRFRMITKFMKNFILLYNILSFGYNINQAFPWKIAFFLNQAKQGT